MRLYSLQDLKKGEFLIIKKIEVNETKDGFYFYGEIPQRLACNWIFSKDKHKKKRVDFAKVVAEVENQEQIEDLLNKTVYPCFVGDKCVAYKFEVNRCETIES